MKLSGWLTNLALLASLTACAAQAAPPAEVPLLDVEVVPVAGQPSAETPLLDEAAVPVTQHPLPPSDNYGPAPEITNDTWLNTDAPIRIAEQRGKVVLVEFLDIWLNKLPTRNSLGEGMV